MLVLGYANQTDAKNPSIIVPPFHTGHLGFVPDTPVRISYVEPPARTDARNCEVVVTPSAEDIHSLALISVVMLDKPGVVARLIDAVAALGINIEVQESSSVNRLDHHSVSLLVDMPEASPTTRVALSPAASEQTTPTAVQRLYRDYESLFPVWDFRFVRLFESIMAHCADVIVWEPVSGEHVPKIDIQAYWDRKLTKPETILLQRGGPPFHVSFDVPPGITHRIRRVLGPSEDCLYLLVSDTATRALHVFFPEPHTTENLFHVGFVHDDVPGALATILGLLSQANFNILTSLVRKQGNGRSVWEAILEYRGGAAVPPNDGRPARVPITSAELEWICQVIVEAHLRSKEAVFDCGIEVAPPNYPKHKNPAEAILLSDRLDSSGGHGAGPDYDPAKLVRKRRKALRKRKLEPLPREAARKSDHLLDVIAKGDKQGELPVVFLSYPHSARRHGKVLRKRLSGHYRVERYQKPDGEVIVDAVKRKIEDSDYFIGIWHHEEEPASGERTKHISPWMLFEYGVASAAEKHAIVVHSDKLDPSVWMRISPGVSNPEYTDIDFASKTVDTILAYCELHFR